MAVIAVEKIKALAQKIQERNKNKPVISEEEIAKEVDIVRKKRLSK